MRKDFHQISVIVPENPFTPEALKDIKHCLCALNVEKLMEWWPGTPHSPNRNPEKVKSIQRSLDWKRVASIAAYLLQTEIFNAPELINKYFKKIYEPKRNDPGREWPPKINKVISYQVSEFPTFSNVLIHINGATVKEEKKGAAKLEFSEKDKKLYFSVIDGQHRINGAYLAICILKENKKGIKWEIPAEVFLDLDPFNEPPKNQAQIFIDVNFNQKKVDRSLVADLYPTTRVHRDSLDNKERSQDIGRKLMLETGPLVGMIQIPGIRYGVKDVISLSTLNGAIEDILEVLVNNGIDGLEIQTEFLSQVLNSWFEATGRFESKSTKNNTILDSQNVVYQGRILVSIIALIPAMIWKLKEENVNFVSEDASKILMKWMKEIANRAGLLKNKIFMDKTEFKKKGFLGSGGIARFRNSLWAATIGTKKKINLRPEKIEELANKNRNKILSKINN